jgi:hypothetical protein
MIKKMWLLSFVWMVVSCIQGPWDYDIEESPEIFVGITSYAYIIADRPLTDVCFQRMLSLNEVVSNKRAFYLEATVSVEGEFSTGDDILYLKPKLNNANCFVGSETSYALKGKSYKLSAKFKWDSSGVEVESVLSSKANVPTSFEVEDSARVIPEVIAPSGVSYENPLAIVEQMPLEAQTELFEEWGSRLPKNQNDTAAFQEFYEENSKELNESIAKILENPKYQIFYKSGDEVFYLGGNLNTVSHTFKSSFSNDVGGVLITHRFEDSANIPFNRFSEIALRFKGKLDPRNLYYEGQIRRLIAYDKMTLPSGESLLENLGIVNTWFFEGENTLYFYGVEKAYMKFINTYVLSADDPKVIPQFNVEGGEGFFVGAVVDSFSMDVKLLPGHPYFSYFETRADNCFQNDWKTSDCRSFVNEYCEGVGYREEEFERDSMSILQEKTNYYDGYCPRIAIEKDLDSSFALGTTLKEYTSKKDSLVLKAGTWRHCIKKEFEGESCAQSLNECSIFESGQSLEIKESEKADGEKNHIEVPTCQIEWWGYCADQNWQGEICKMASVNWCKQDGKILDEVLCEEAKEYCKQNPSYLACENK